MRKIVKPLYDWSTYLLWSDFSQNRLNKLLKKNKEEDEFVFKVRFTQILFEWLGRLWIVVQGWEKIKQENYQIKKMLSSSPSYRVLLYKFFKLSFNYQPLMLTEIRNNPLFKDENFYKWAYSLNSEFNKFAWNWPGSFTRCDYSENEILLGLIERNVTVLMEKYENSWNMDFKERAVSIIKLLNEISESDVNK